MQCSKKVVVEALAAVVVVIFLATQFLDVSTDSWNDYWLPLQKADISATGEVSSVVLNSNASTNADTTTAVTELEYNITRLSLKQENLTLCPTKPENLVGPIRVWLDAPALETIESLYPWLTEGGHGHPEECVARNKVAVVVPYRDRDQQLRIFLHNLHSFLKKQQLDYGIFIVEQIANQTFNRAKLMNVGFAVANRMYDWDCFIFHDVDLLPEDDRNLYSCPEQPRHMSVAVDKFGYKLPYGSLFGGVSAMTKEQFSKMNGFSNDYWGWGGEDDDISARVIYSGYKISRYPMSIARYKMVKHKKETLNPVNQCRYALMGKTKSRWRTDGLQNLKFNVLRIQTPKVYTRILVDLCEEELRPALGIEIRKCRWSPNLTTTT